MINVIEFASSKGKRRVEPEQALYSAIEDLLHSNANVARAVGELPARFVAVDASIAGVTLNPRCRDYVDGLVEQDRQRCLQQYVKSSMRRLSIPWE